MSDESLNPHLPNLHRFFRHYRAGINPPYRKKDFFAIILTLIVLLAVPVTILAALNSRGETIKAAPLAAESKENKVKRLSLDLLKANKDFKAGKKQAKTLKTLAKERKQLLLDLIDTDPEEIGRIAFDSKIRSTLPDEVKIEVEEPVDVEGEVEVAHGDDFTGETAKFYYKMKDRNLDLHFVRDNPDLVSGTKIRVRGNKIDNKVVVAQREGDLQVTAPAKVLAATQTKKVAVILFNFASNTTQPWTAATVQGFVFTNSNSVKAFHKENSFNLIDMQGKNSANGEVYGWYTIPNSTATCDYSGWGTAARNAATSAGVDLSGYTQIVHMFPNTSSCGWAGLAYLPGRDSYINGYLNLGVISHELGHSFGSHHASSYSCTEGGSRVPISSTCTLSEYGDPFDTMGSGGGKHFNNFNKGRMGIYDPVNTQDITASGTYTVYPIEHTSNNVKSLRILRDSRYYYIEYRQPFGFDNFSSTNPVVKGVTIRLAPNYTSVVQSWLVDTVASTTTFSDAPLQLDQTFTDAAKGITIKTVGTTSTSAQVEITLGSSSCVRANPTVGLSPASQWALPGQNKNYTLTITNRDNSACGSSTFSSTFGSANGLTRTQSSLSKTLAPGETGTLTTTITSPGGLADGFYSFSETIRNNSATTFSASASSNYNVGDVTAPTVAINLPQNGATVQENLNITVTATDDLGVKQVDYYIDGNVVGTSSVNPFGLTWDTTTVSNGNHTLAVVAVDFRNNTSSQVSRTINVNNTGGAKLGDINQDGAVGILDLSTLLSTWGTSNAASDLNNDGKVDILDLSTLLTQWGT